MGQIAGLDRSTTVPTVPAQEVEAHLHVIEGNERVQACYRRNGWRLCGPAGSHKADGTVVPILEYPPTSYRTGPDRTGPATEVPEGGGRAGRPCASEGRDAGDDYLDAVLILLAVVVVGELLGDARDEGELTGVALARQVLGGSSQEGRAAGVGAG